MVNKFIRLDALLRSATSSSRPLLSSSLISLRYSTVPTIIFVEHSFLLSGICIERFEVLSRVRHGCLLVLLQFAVAEKGHRGTDGSQLFDLDFAEDITVCQSVITLSEK